MRGASGHHEGRVPLECRSIGQGSPSVHFGDRVATALSDRAAIEPAAICAGFWTKREHARREKGQCGANATLAPIRLVLGRELRPIGLHEIPQVSPTLIQSLELAEVQRDWEPA